MPKSILCSIEGCEKTVIARGWCAKHYQRWQAHRDPLALLIKASVSRTKKLAFIADIALPYKGDDCLIWPFSRTGKGYAGISVNGQTAQASREVCRMIHGDPPSPEHHAAHSCGKGHLGCISPQHLSWKTPTENEADKIVHGTKPLGSKVGGAKLKESDVQEILTLRNASLSQRAIASRYGVSQTLIWRIWKGKAWTWLTGISATASTTSPT